MAGYTRQSAADIVPGAEVTAAPLNNEFNQIQSAMHGSTGHNHQGGSGNGPQLSLTAAVTGTLPIANGGTNATTAAAARTSLFGISTTVDNTVPRFDGTTGAIQTSGVVISDTNAVSGIVGLTVTGGGSLTGTWTNLGTVTTIDINGGTVDGAIIGGSSAAAGTFTTATASTAFRAAAGSAGTPSISFTGDTNTGLYNTADTLLVTTGGTLAATFGSTGSLTLVGGLTATTGTFSGAVSMTGLTATSGEFTGQITATSTGQNIVVQSPNVLLGPAYIRYQDSAATNIAYIGLGSGSTDTLSVARNIAGKIEIDAAASGTVDIVGTATFFGNTVFDGTTNTVKASDNTTTTYPFLIQNSSGTQVTSFGAYGMAMTTGTRSYTILAHDNTSTTYPIKFSNNAGTQTLEIGAYGMSSTGTGDFNLTAGDDINITATGGNLNVTATATALSGTLDVTGAVDSSGTVTGSSIITAANFSREAAGTLNFRPSGNASTTGQMTLSSAGALTVAAGLAATTGSFSSTLSVTGTSTLTGNVTTAGSMTFDSFLTSSDTSAILSTTGAGTVFLRPNGSVSSTGQTTIASTGDMTVAGNITSSSDVRLKTDIETVADALAKVNALRGTTFIKNGKKSLGVIAQEVQEVFPEVVIEDEDGYLSVAYGNLVGVLIEAIKELTKEVEELKRK